MTYETIETQKNEGVTTVRLNRPNVHNAMNERLMKELVTCFKQLIKDGNTRIIIITGNGK